MVISHIAHNKMHFLNFVEGMFYHVSRPGDSHQCCVCCGQSGRDSAIEYPGSIQRSWKYTWVNWHSNRKWFFPNIGVGPKNGWYFVENPIKMDDLGGPPLFLETIKLAIWTCISYSKLWFSSVILVYGRGFGLPATPNKEPSKNLPQKVCAVQKWLKWLNWRTWE